MISGHRTKLYLHIGRHKCGTSTLQHFLCASAEALAACGVVYPETFRAPVAHHPVAQFYNPRMGQPADKAAMTGAVQAFWRALQDEKAAIVSSEAFQNIVPMRLQADLVPFDLTVIVYLREPLDYLLSAYAQRVKGGGGTETLDVFSERFRPDYRRFLTNWRTAFPDAEFKVRSFARDRLVGRDIRRDFLDCVGLEPGAAEALHYPDVDSNVSIGGPLLEFMRRLNQRGPMDSRVRTALYQACQDIAVQHAEYRRRPAMPAALQEAVRARHAEALAWVVDSYFAGDTPFPRRSFPVGEIDHSLDRGACDLILERLGTRAPNVAETLKARIEETGPLHDI